MGYEHSKKVGNEGDLVKHVALAAVVADLLQRYGGPFVYAESHTGRAEYVLTSGGAWEAGVGLFSRNECLIEDYRCMWTGDLPKLRWLVPFFEVACGGKTMQAGMTYAGSSALVLRFLERARRPRRLELWELDAQAAEDLQNHYRGRPGVNVHQGDGYAGIAGIQEASLVLIDPWRLDEEEQGKILASMDALDKREIPVICWTPLLSEPTESRQADQFLQATRHRFLTYIDVHWPHPAGRMVGCRLTVSLQVPVAEKTVHQLCDLMGWQVESRSGWMR